MYATGGSEFWILAWVVDIANKVVTPRATLAGTYQILTMTTSVFCFSWKCFCFLDFHISVWNQKIEMLFLTVNLIYLFSFQEFENINQNILIWLKMKNKVFKGRWIPNIIQDFIQAHNKWIDNLCKQQSLTNPTALWSSQKDSQDTETVIEHGI